MFVWMVLLLVLLPSFGHAATRLGLHVTLEEKNLWNIRRTDNVNGVGGVTFKTMWDTRILNAANTFKAQAHPGGDGRWNGWPGPGCYPSDPTQGSATQDAGKSNAIMMMKSAFVFLVTGDTTYASGAAAELLSQITIANTDFNNTGKWCRNIGNSNVLITIGPWLTRLLFTYDYLLAGGYTGFSAAQKTSLNTWFINAALWAESVYENVITNGRFSGGRDAPPNYTCDGFACPGSQTADTHWNGTDTFTFHRGWDNRSCLGMVFVGSVGILTNNTTLKDSAKLFFQESIRYSSFADGSIFDQNRWADHPNEADGILSAWGHLWIALGPKIMLADHFARTGDSSLYEYASPSGLFGSGGSNIKLFNAVKQYAKLQNNTVQWYGTDNGTLTEATRMHSSPSTDEFAHQTMAMANTYYKDSEIESAYSQTIGSLAACGAFGNCHNAPWGVVVDGLFLFGNNEASNPYTLVGPPTGHTPVAINATAIERAQWQTRAVSGPYKSDWDVLKARADSFRSSPGPRFQGNTSNPAQCYGAVSVTISRTYDMGLRDAAFVYFVTGDTSYVANVRQELLEQTTIPGTQFQNTAKWCIGSTTATTTGFGNGIGVWLRKLAYAYSYIKPTLSTADQNTLNTWFTNAGVHIQAVLNEVVKKRFPNRLTDVYTPLPAAGTLRGKTHFGGSNVYSSMEAWSNEGMGTGAALAVIAVLVNNNTLKAHASRLIQEAIKYSTFPGGQMMDQSRWQFGATTGTPQHGYLYPLTSLGSTLTAADVLARDGYINLFNYSTTVGMHGTEGGPKTLLKIMQHYARLTNGTLFEYASATGTGDANDRIDPVGDLTRVEYINLTQGGNLQYQDAEIKTAYEKAIPGSYDNSGCDMLGGDWCALPGARFMYGGLEGISFPYGGGTPPAQTEPDYTSNLTMHLKFDEGTGATAQDSTANNHDGTLSAGATWGAAKMGASALVVDGTLNGVVTVSGELGTPGAVTLAAWVKVSAFPTAEGHVLSIGDSVQVAVGPTYIKGWHYTGATWSSATATRTLGTTDWHHLAWVVQAGTQRLYLDGEQVATGSNGAQIVYAGLGPNTIIGGHGNGHLTNYRFQGSIDDVRVYSRALTAVDIAGLADLEDTPPASTLSVLITTPTSEPTISTTGSPILTFGGTAMDETGVTGVTWSCPTCAGDTSGTAICTPDCGASATSVTWSVTGISTAPGSNLLTVTASDAAGTRTDTLTVTYTPPVVGGEACTYYAAQTGLPGNSGTTRGSPIRVVDFWALATPGMSLCLLPGTYTGGNSMIVPPVNLAGTSALPITIKADTVDEGLVLLDGQYARNPVVLGSTNVNLILQGLNARNGLTAVYQFLGATQVGRRLVGWQEAGGAGIPAIFSLTGAGTMVEDSAGWGHQAQTIFKGSGTVSSPEGGCRRCWCEWNSVPPGSSTPGTCYQPGVDQRFENVLGTLRETGP